MAEITKMLGIGINDYDAGRLSPEQLIAIVQEAIDNGMYFCRTTSSMQLQL